MSRNGCGDAFSKIMRRMAAHALRMSKKYEREKSRLNANKWMIRHLTVTDLLSEYEQFKGFKPTYHGHNKGF